VYAKSVITSLINVRPSTAKMLNDPSQSSREQSLRQAFTFSKRRRLCCN